MLQVPPPAPTLGADRPSGLIGRVLPAVATPSLMGLAVAFGGGVALYFALDREPASWVAIAAGLIAAGLAVLTVRTTLFALTAALLAATAGFSAAMLRTAAQPPLLDLPARAVTVEGVVVSVDILPEGRRVRLTGATLLGEGAKLPRDLRIRLHRSDLEQVLPGERVRVRALIRPPAPPASPGAFDFQRHAFFLGLGGVGFALAPAERLASANIPRTSASLAALRQTIIQRVLAALGGTEGSVAAALLTGQRQAIPEPVLEDLRRAGLAHLLAVSGLHVGIVAGLAYLVCRFALALWPPLLLHLSAKKVAAVVGVAAGFGYMLLTGSQVPMRRAVAMAALVALAVLLDRRLSALRALAFAALVVLTLQPEALLGASFQMSFAAVLALVAVWEGVRRSWLSPRRERGLPARLAVGFVAVLLTSLVASAATAPFVAHHFQRVPLYGPVANAVAVPLTSFWIMPWGLLALALMPLGLEPLALAPMGWGISAVVAVAETVSSWPLAAPALPATPSWTPAAAALGLVLLCLARPVLKPLGLVVLAAGPLAAVLSPQPDVLIAPDGRALALRLEGSWHLLARPDADRFVLAQWRQRAGDLPFHPLSPRLPPSPAIRCDGTACLIGPDERPNAILVLREGAVAPWCGRAPLILSLEPVRGRCAASIVLDRFAPWRNGAYAIWFEGPEIVSDAAWRGERPWVRFPGRPPNEGRWPSARSPTHRTEGEQRKTKQGGGCGFGHGKEVVAHADADIGVVAEHAVHAATEEKPIRLGIVGQGVDVHEQTSLLCRADAGLGRCRGIHPDPVGKSAKGGGRLRRSRAGRNRRQTRSIRPGEGESNQGQLGFGAEILQHRRNEGLDEHRFAAFEQPLPPWIRQFGEQSIGHRGEVAHAVGAERLGEFQFRINADELSSCAVMLICDLKNLGEGRDLERFATIVEAVAGE